MRISKEILSRVVEAYRKIRNTMRYLVANLYDFDPSADAVPVPRMEEVDRYMLARYGELARRLVAAYEAYDYPTIFQAVNSFTTVDLSALYNDISKDRLYTFGARSRERRSAQTAMYMIADGLTRLLAPLVPVTADQLWASLPNRKEASVHIARFPESSDLLALADSELVQRWNQLVAVRDVVLAEIEPLRKDKQIGSSLQAKAVVAAPHALLELLQRHAADLPMLFIVSGVELRPSGDDRTVVTIERAGGVRCDRCWRYVPAVSTDPEWEGLCERCQEALAETIHG
jgi:isoleucyl-tRNA synthetase